MKKIYIILFFLTLLGFFYKPVLFESRYPIPSDNLVYLFHPFRDYFADTNPRGIPYKNPLVVDPVTQQIPWKILGTTEIASSNLPLWNPYSMAGYPLLGNIQSSPLYPFNFLLALPFIQGWTIFIILQQLLAGLFFYFYIRNHKLSEIASLLGSATFSFCGFIISWLEWGTIVHTGMWLPLILLALDKYSGETSQKKWLIIFATGIAMSYLAGHLQTFVYLLLFTIIYSLVFIPLKKNIVFGVTILLVFLLLSPVVLAQVTHLLLSARNVDLNWQEPGWFLPWQHLVQFIAPDFFGNPSTGNYFGVWNYGEFIGYIGILPLLCAIIAGVFVRNKRTLFFVSAVLISLLFMLPNPISQLPFQLSIPFLASAQPTRMLFIVDFSLCVLAVIGFEYLIKTKRRLNIYLIFPLVFVLLLFLLGYFIVGKNGDYLQYWSVTKKNLILPTALLVSSTALLLFHSYFPEKKRIFASLVILFVTILDLLFFATKYTPFVSENYFYPKTSAILFLEKDIKENRIMATDRRIFHPNIPIIYKIQSIDGYDPLYLQRYGELMAAAKRNNPDISSPFGFNRIITPNNFDNEIINLLGVKYILTLNDYSNESLEKVFQEGETRIYENKDVFPRVFLVNNLHVVANKKEAITAMFGSDMNLRSTAIIEDTSDTLSKNFASGSATILEYKANKVSIEVASKGESFLVLTDTFYPSWKAFISGKVTKIYRTDYNFRGVIVPKGKHIVEFRNTLL